MRGHSSSVRDVMWHCARWWEVTTVPCVMWCDIVLGDERSQQFHPWCCIYLLWSTFGVSRAGCRSPHLVLSYRLTRQCQHLQFCSCAAAFLWYFSVFLSLLTAVFDWFTPHSFILGLKPSANRSHRSLPFLLQGWLHGFPRLFTDTSEHIRFLLFSFSVFPLFNCWFRVCSVNSLVTESAANTCMWIHSLIRVHLPIVNDVS